MPGRRYPRPGHRLAPRLLAELLQDTLPTEYAGQGVPEFVRLSDLDERAWDRFGPDGCTALADRIVRAVGRAARQPGPLSTLRLPPLPDGMSLVSLELESRTFNCLAAAGIGDRPQDLGCMTVEGVLGLRGFWSKCLVDLLTAIEYATDHPDSRAKPKSRRISGAPDRQTFGRYPRRGYRLAPAALRDILEVPVPGREVSNPSIRGLNLCDLDERISQTLDDRDLSLLGRAIIARVNGSSHHRSLKERKFPAPPKGLRLQDLALENRTYNCLLREGLASRFEAIGNYTIGDLLALKAFGAKCLLDLLSSLETAVARSQSLDAGLTRQAEALGAVPEVSQIHFSDPRLGAALRSVDHQAETLADLAQRVVHRRVDPPNPAATARQLAEIRGRIQQMSRMDLGEELAEVFAPTSQARDRQIISEYYGWDGGGGRTLEELGNRHGLSRERIRQVCLHAAKRHRHSRVFAPVLDKALQFIQSHLPIATSDLRCRFEAADAKGLFLDPKTILQAAEFLSRDGNFCTVNIGDVELVVDAQSAHLPKKIAQVARRLALTSGIATVSDVIQQVETCQSSRAEPSLVWAVLEAMAGFQWLAHGKNWFHLESGSQYGLPNMMDKVFSVCPRIDISRLRAALGRHRRSGRKLPPSRVLVDFCRQRSAVRVQGRMVLADSPPLPADTLSGVEAVMIRVLQEHGPIMERGLLEEHCMAEGMNRFSFNATLMSSPVIAQFGRSVYGLVGTTVNRRKVQCLAARRSARAASRVLRGFGTLADGRIYLLYQLSKAAIAGGVTTVPSGLKHRLGGNFRIWTADGVESGTLVTRGGCAWGLGPALRGQNARPGDHMVLLVDLQQQSARVYLGERDLLDTLIESLSLQVAETWKSEDLAAVTGR